MSENIEYQEMDEPFSGIPHLTLFTKASEDDANLFHAYWMLGKTRQGIINVRLEVDLSPADKRIAAELSAMQHLLENRNVAGTDRAGNSMKLTVSAGAIKKLKNYPLGNSPVPTKRMLAKEKMDLIPYAMFLRLRFADAELDVDTTFNWLKPRAENSVEDIVLTEPMHARFYLNGAGDLFVTAHSLDAFYIRNNSSSGAIAWRNLRRLLSSPDTKPYRPSKSGQKEERHGFAAEYFRNKEAGWTFVVANEDGRRILVTAYPTR